MAAQIYSQIDKGPDGQITEGEFIRIWQNSETAFLNQISRNNAEIAKANEQKRNIEEKVRTLISQEKQGRGFRDSILTLNVLDAQNLQFDSSVVTVIFKDQKYASEIGNTNFPIYNSSFQFKEVDLKDTIDILVNTVSQDIDDEQHYKGVIKAEDLTDQKIHELWLPLTLRNKKTDAKLHMNVQYIYSQVRITQEAIRGWDELINDLEVKNQKLRQDLQELYRPYDLITTIGTNENTLKLKANENLQIEDVNEPKFVHVPGRSIHPLFYAAFVVSLGVVGICLTSIDYKYPFLIDLCVFFALLAMYIFKEIGFTLQSLLATLLLAIIAFAIEVIWYRTYPKNWTGSVYVDDGSLVGLRNYQGFSSVLSMILKAILILVLLAAVFVEYSKRKTI